VQLGSSESHQLPPECRGEHGIPVGHHGLRNPVEANDLAEKRLGHGLCTVGVSQWNKMAVFAKSVNHSENH